MASNYVETVESLSEEAKTYLQKLRAGGLEVCPLALDDGVCRAQ